MGRRERWFNQRRPVISKNLKESKKIEVGMRRINKRLAKRKEGGL